MNSVVLIGRLTRDPEIRYTANTQMAVATFTIAIDRPVRAGGEKQTDFPRITVFGKQAENCERYLAKGRLVGVQGRLQTGSYQNKDGVTVYTTDVVADRVEFLEWGDRPSGGSAQRQNTSSNYGQQGGYSSQGNQGGYGAPQQSGYNDNQGGMPEEMPDSFQAIDEDVPF
ncbi:MAG: single-stranded DNA-binding protein [Emergencia sp.]